MTEVFRLLSRSTTFTKRPSKFEPNSAPASTSIATQAISNDLKKKKRKNPSAQAATKPNNAWLKELDLPRELDFFGTVSHYDTPRKRARVDGESKDSEGSDADSSEEEEHNEDSKDVEVSLPTLEESKGVLRKNKLKFTLLASYPTTDSISPKKSKKSKLEPGPETKKKKPELIVPPLTDFSHLHSRQHGYALSKRVYANILTQGYSAPTEVQMGSLPVFMNQNLKIEGISEGTPIDLLTCAPTGSGKTLAYTVPLLDRILAMKDRQKGVKAIILAPTKELVGQIVNEIKKLALGTAIRVSQMKKGMSPVSAAAPDDSSEEPAIKSDIIVSTPLVLLHAIDGLKDLRSISGIHNLILDEADALLDGQFREQTLGIWRHLRDYSTEMRTSLWSATISSSVEEIALDQLPNSAIVRLIVGIKDVSLPSISQKLIYTGTEKGKLLALRQTFTSGLKPPIIIFMQSVSRAQALYDEIKFDLPTPGRIAVLHAELTDDKREATMTLFRKGEIWVLITTDLLARGMDFCGVRFIVNYDIPTSVTAYIHRVGRTGRAGREGGEAVTYYTKEDIQYVRIIANVIASSEKEGGGDGRGIQKWLLESLPKVSKNTKKNLKAHGVEIRQKKKGARISSKSGYQRQMENRLKDMKKATVKRKRQLEKEKENEAEGAGDNSDGDISVGGGSEEFTGFD